MTATIVGLRPAERLLPAVWRLVAPGANGAVDDVEALVVGAAAEVFRRNPGIAATLTRDDAVEHLLGEVWPLFTRYDPAKQNGSASLSGYLYDRLRFRLLDHWRKQFGRNGQKLTLNADDDEFRLLDQCDRPLEDEEPWRHAVPTGISPAARSALDEIGDLLVEGLTYREIAVRLDPARSEDYVAGRVALLKRELGPLLLEAA